MQEHTRVGDFVIANGAVRQEGTSQYMPMEFPAVPSADMVFALEEAAKEKDVNYHIGVVQSKDSFMDNTTLTPCQFLMSLIKMGCLGKGCSCSEMEASTLCCWCYRKLRTGALLVVYGDQNRQEALAKTSI